MLAHQRRRARQGFLRAAPDDKRLHVFLHKQGLQRASAKRGDVCLGQNTNNNHIYCIYFTREIGTSRWYPLPPHPDAAAASRPASFHPPQSCMHTVANQYMHLAIALPMELFKLSMTSGPKEHRQMAIGNQQVAISSWQQMYEQRTLIAGIRRVPQCGHI